MLGRLLLAGRGRRRGRPEQREPKSAKERQRAREREELSSLALELTTVVLAPSHRVNSARPKVSTLAIDGSPDPCGMLLILDGPSLEIWILTNDHTNAAPRRFFQKPDYRGRVRVRVKGKGKVL